LIPEDTPVKLNDPSLLRQQALIHGEWLPADSGATIAVHNPANGEVLATVPRMGRAETRRAIDSAQQAFPDWRERTADERAQCLQRWFALVLQHADDLALIMTLEQGKPLSEARGEISYAASYIQWFAEEARRVYGDVIPSPWRNRELIVLKEPVGVVAAITPWNFPAAMVTRKVAPALAAGCTVIVKPASQTPLSALALAELALRAGVPPGVVNVVTGSASEIGGALTDSPVVRKLSFTGSTEVGRALAAQSAATLKKLSLELGGNAPFIVFEDADVDAAVQGAMDSKFRNAGQTCVCTNRMIVHHSVYDVFVARLSARVKDLAVGPGVTPGVEQGPLIDEAAVSKVSSLLADAVASGAEVTVGGERHALGGTFFAPTVLAGVRPDMAIAREEIFGPVAAVYRFETEAEAVALANDTEYGLAAYFYARDLSRVWRVARQLDYGMVGINSGLISTAVAPFGGVKQSGYGREGSRQGIEEYMQTKYLCMNVG
jgi:succinate-semialdehyde dehydrogenase/glutarate-semialdehyde dehydrogenase